MVSLRTCSNLIKLTQKVIRPLSNSAVSCLIAIEVCMSRRYSKELALESGSPLGIAPRSDYSGFARRDAKGSVVSRDMKTVGDDMRRSEVRFARHITTSDGRRIEAAKGKVFVIKGSKVSQEDAGRKQTSTTDDFNKYAKLYWSTRR